jgi:tetratricopeptide (TPR) repeat protein
MPQHDIEASHRIQRVGIQENPLPTMCSVNSIRASAEVNFSIEPLSIPPLHVQKLPYRADDGDAYERATLILANIHAAAGRLDAAADCAQSCLTRNGASSQAWEVAGYVAELRNDAKAATDAYAAAWKLARMSSPAVGYRLAWNHLRSGAFVLAVTAVLEVLDKFPDYPKITADVMMPALARIRCASERDSQARHALAPPEGTTPIPPVVNAVRVCSTVPE